MQLQHPDSAERMVTWEQLSSSSGMAPNTIRDCYKMMLPYLARVSNSGATKFVFWGGRAWAACRTSGGQGARVETQQRVGCLHTRQAWACEERHSMFVDTVHYTGSGWAGCAGFL